MLPIIPVVGEAGKDQSIDNWPKGKLDPEDFRGAIEARFRAIVQLELAGGIVKTVIGWLGAHFGETQASDYIINAMKSYLQKADLT